METTLPKPSFNGHILRWDLLRDKDKNGNFLVAFFNPNDDPDDLEWCHIDSRWPVLSDALERLAYLHGPALFDMTEPGIYVNDETTLEDLHSVRMVARYFIEDRTNKKPLVQPLEHILLKHFENTYLTVHRSWWIRTHPRYRQIELSDLRPGAFEAVQ